MTDFDTMSVTRGRDAALTLHLTRDGSPLDLSGMTVDWWARLNDNDLAMALGPILGEVQGDAADGVVVVNLSADDTDTLTEAAYMWWADVDDGTRAVVVARGLLTVLDGADPPVRTP